ncbi:hypothetical protein BDP55DRAFT_67106 [Colletotrichum godetiae]|uniref:Secreted protein n=1 Tax=Colletotrichum godetiae TaxID=1209918 RepID=A0AAJ0AT49_9PEZI|nr:uncharacterized protein BDP55DRAFT_67106 [Colletotrichum godetiae]KAK1688355.1 hypothetical protein BDP55DRAFT_67106 [Colletotrichum godetiae]
MRISTLPLMVFSITVSVVISSSTQAPCLVPNTGALICKHGADETNNVQKKKGLDQARRSLGKWAIGFFFFFFFFWYFLTTRPLELGIFFVCGHVSVSLDVGLHAPLAYAHARGELRGQTGVHGGLVELFGRQQRRGCGQCDVAGGGGFGKPWRGIGLLGHGMAWRGEFGVSSLHFEVLLTNFRYRRSVHSKPDDISRLEMGWILTTKQASQLSLGA